MKKYTLETQKEKEELFKKQKQNKQNFDNIQIDNINIFAKKLNEKELEIVISLMSNLLSLKKGVN